MAHKEDVSEQRRQEQEAAKAADAQTQRRQAKSLGVTPGQGEVPDPDGDNCGPQRYLLWHGWQCDGQVKDKTSLWWSPHEPRFESKTTEPILAPHDEPGPVNPETGKRKWRKVVRQVHVRDRDGTRREVPAERVVIRPAAEPYALNWAVKRQLAHDREAAVKRAREGREAAKAG